MNLRSAVLSEKDILALKVYMKYQDTASIEDILLQTRWIDAT